MRISRTIASRSGFTVVSALVLAVVIGIASFAGLAQSSRARRTEGNLNQQIIAQLYASELLELFRSFNSSSSLLAYLQANPVVPANRPYFFCSLINVLDRKNNVLLNADPLAALPPSSLDAGPAELAANRYYMIQIVDANGASLDPAGMCNATYATAHFDYLRDDGTSVPAAQRLVPANNLRMLVTVGVSWVPKGKAIADKQEVVLSTLLPVN